MSDGRNPTPPAAQNGAAPANCATTGCPHAGVTACPADFVLDAPCRIVLAGGGSVQMTASELPGFSGGSFAWTTASTKVTIGGANAATSTVTALAAPSTGRDAETITVTRTAAGCPTLTKTVQLTVARVTFSAAANQRYGYDDFDTPADPLDDHISVKRSDYTTVHVEIAGGAVGTDFTWACDDPAKCAPVAPGGSASFDLRLNAGDLSGGTLTKDSAVLHARCRCAAATSFSHLAVHVYKEKTPEVVVAKIHDSASAGTALRFGTADYAANAATVNARFQAAVVTCSFTNYDAANGMTNVRYDLDGNGTLSYDIKAGGGAEFDAIRAAMTGTGTKTRVAVIRDMKSFYYLSAAAAVGDTTVTVTAASVFTYPGGTYPLGRGASAEMVGVASSAGSIITLTAALTKAHAAGAPLEFPAAGWSSDPIIVTEGTSSLDAIKMSIAHETGHRTLGLADITDASSAMHWDRSRTDYRLRYIPRNKVHSAGTESQWETVTR